MAQVIEMVQQFGARPLIENQLQPFGQARGVASIGARLGASGATPRGGHLAPGGEPVTATPCTIRAIRRMGN